MIEVASLHAAESGLRVAYRVSEAAALLEAGESFDVLCCMEMLEHVPEPAQVLSPFARLVRPGGHVFVSTLNRNLRAFLGAIVGAEYVMRLLPRGTHEYDRFIKPSGARVVVRGRPASSCTTCAASTTTRSRARRA